MRRRRSTVGETAAVLDAVHEIGEHLGDGLRGRGTPAATRRLRSLLHADTVVLADLEQPLAISGRVPDTDELSAVLARTFEHGATARHAGWTAVPLLVDGELTGALAATGAGESDLEAAGRLVTRCLDHSALRRARARIAQAELRTLRAQISPHFLHNALAVIAARIKADPPRARTLLNDFADYLRYSFSHQGDYATVAAELQATQTYLELQRARFDDRMEITVRMAPEILPVALPFLVVQPIVENAVRHGLEPRPGPGTVTVSGFGEGPLCVIVIEDDGVGMDPEQAQAVLAGAWQRPVTEEPGAGVGLANVDRRLRTVYGPEYGLVIETAPGLGTKVVIRVPRFMRGVRAAGGPRSSRAHPVGRTARGGQPPEPAAAPAGAGTEGPDRAPPVEVPAPAVLVAGPAAGARPRGEPGARDPGTAPEAAPGAAPGERPGAAPDDSATAAATHGPEGETG
ncbi:sensor histidine kinase [Streptomyces bohaiensis]|uniref:sensor histidine kinase n=1 Tax=Streptomyces bohaiensis TaxID=1431344 RepID=UPI003B7676B8